MPEANLKEQLLLMRSIMYRKVRVRAASDPPHDEGRIILPVAFGRATSGNLYIRGHEYSSRTDAWGGYLWLYTLDDYNFEVIE